MAQIDKPNLHFNTKLYTGTGSSNALTGINFQPDLTWIKKRNGTNYHVWTDAVRLATKQIYSNDNGAEQTVAEGLKSFDSDGFTLGTNGDTNGSGGSYVAWNWKANGAGSANTDGSINTTATSVNTTAGFSISKYTGTAATATIGHGLGVAPKMIITKRISGGAEDWGIYHESIGATKYLKLNATDVQGSSSGVWNNTAPTSSVFSVGSSSLANGSGTYVAYCFAEKKGFSKFGSYEGNANANGPFIYTGFKPALVLIKGAISGDGNAAQNWELYDNKRPGSNSANAHQRPNTTGADSTSVRLDILSNGFRPIINSDGLNDNASTYVYWALAENPIVGSNNIPAVAR